MRFCARRSYQNMGDIPAHRSTPDFHCFRAVRRDLLSAVPRFLLNHARYCDWFERETAAELTAAPTGASRRRTRP
jgi:hypothetical protein